MECMTFINFSLGTGGASLTSRKEKNLQRIHRSFITILFEIKKVNKDALKMRY